MYIATNSECDYELLAYCIGMKILLNNSSMDYLIFYRLTLIFDVYDIWFLYMLSLTYSIPVIHTKHNHLGLHK